MEKFLNSEKNIKENKNAFMKAIGLVSIDEIYTEVDENTIHKLVDSVDKTKLFILGEIHGVKENVDIIYTLFKKFGFRQLALEWTPKSGELVKKFIESGDIDFEVIENSPDGRITAGHFALIKKLKDEGLLDKLICFDEEGYVDWDSRDENMAKNIISNLADLPTLVVAGNKHTRIETIKFDDEKGEHHPMGQRVKSQIPEVPTGRIEYLKGQYHNFGVNDFLEMPLGEKGLVAKFHINEDGLYEFVLPEAHAAIVPNPDERL